MAAAKTLTGVDKVHRCEESSLQPPGNHGQSLAFAGSRAGVAVTIGAAATKKNAAMRSFGAELIEYGRGFDDAKEQAARIATQRNLEYAPSFHRDLVVGCDYAFELFTGAVDLETGIRAYRTRFRHLRVIGTRDLLGLRTKIVGAVAERANSYSRSVAAGRIMPTASALTFADGMAARPDGARCNSARC